MKVSLAEVGIILSFLAAGSTALECYNGVKQDAAAQNCTSDDIDYCRASVTPETGGIVLSCGSGAKGDKDDCFKEGNNHVCTCTAENCNQFITDCECDEEGKDMSGGGSGEDPNAANNDNNNGGGDTNGDLTNNDDTGNAGGDGNTDNTTKKDDNSNVGSMAMMDVRIVAACVSVVATICARFLG